MAKKEESSGIIDASFIMNSPKKTISVSPAIDIGLSGRIGEGLQEGCWILLAGGFKAGKTMTALQIAANFQQQLGKKIYYGNAEQRIKARDLSGIHNLDIDKVKIIQSAKGRIMSAEEHLTQYREILTNESDVVLIIDSVSHLCSKGEMDGEITATRRSDGPKLIATFCRQLAPIVPIQDSVVISILHVIANTGYGPATKCEDGGNKIQYQADVKMACSHFKIIGEEGSAGYGQEVNWKVHTSALGRPGSKLVSFLRYGYGIDCEKELIDIGKSCGLIEAKSAWHKFADTEEFCDMNFQGEEKLRQYLFENKDKRDKLIEKINEMI